jgi:hypothetical protein
VQNFRVGFQYRGTCYRIRIEFSEEEEEEKKKKKKKSDHNSTSYRGHISFQNSSMNRESTVSNTRGVFFLLDR